MASLTEIYTAMLAATQTLSALTQALTVSSGAFQTSLATLSNSILQLPHTTASSSAAPGTPGGITFSSSLATGFIIQTTSSGATVKVPYYSNP